MRRRITLLVAATTSVVLLAFLVPAALLVQRVAETRALETARQQLQFLVPAAGLDSPDAVRSTLGDLHGGPLLAVRWTDGAWLTAPGATPDGQVPGSAEVLSTPSGTRLVQPVRRADGTVVIEAFVPADLLRAGVTRTWLVLGGLGLVLFVLALLVADRLARGLTRPITELAATAHGLSRGDLAARVVPSGPPEVRDVGVALNRLADRIGELLAAEREAAADLAHRLRTPLTALRLDAEALPPEDRARLVDDVDAVSRGVDEVIREARRPIREGLGAGCDATAVVSERVGFWSALAADEARPLRLELHEGPLPVGMPSDDLAAALDALLGNVFTHTAEGTGVRVGLRPRKDGGAVVTVSDEGPGMPESAVARGASGGGSTGLGLDIARRTAEASGGGLCVRSSAEGTAVTLELGAPQTTRPRSSISRGWASTDRSARGSAS